MKHPLSLHSLLHTFDQVDPYNEIDGLSSLAHLGRPHLGRPRFNVSETKEAFLLDGELPGVTDSKQITVEWFQSQVLIIRGITKPSDAESMKDPFQGDLANDLPPAKEHEEKPIPGHSKAQLEAMVEKPKPALPRRLLSERFIGEFMRSFTFPSEVDSNGMKAHLTDGLLRITVPKMKGATEQAKQIPVS